MPLSRPPTSKGCLKRDCTNKQWTFKTGIGLYLQAIRDSGGKVPPPNPKDAVKKTAKKRQSMPASLPPPAVEGGVEFQNLLGHLEPLPFQSVIQSVDFVDVHQAAGAAGLVTNTHFYHFFHS